ncbi:hypothetical protein CK203_027922 [Vitis vinifera]|uniref:Uncharacterized protein n=1 Tax=Vitis vinifera TaxID=29760 RepID=A0A438J3N1_VITVI|nr:hypothetical protein CK203_027922 [Vitis vinifera]
MSEREGENYLALTGPFPDLKSWSATVPELQAFGCTKVFKNRDKVASSVV